MIGTSDRWIWSDHGTQRTLHIHRVLNRTNRPISRFRLQDQIRLEQTNATFETGDIIENPTEKHGDNADALYWAYIETIGGGERFRGLQTVAETTHMVVVRNPDRPYEALICECKEEV